MVELQIEGLACSGCVTAVEKAISAADPAAQTDIDLDTGRTRVTTQLPREHVISVVEAAGYDVVDA